MDEIMETLEQYVARVGLEPPSDPEVAAIWWKDAAFNFGAQWEPAVTTLWADRKPTAINRIAPPLEGR